MSYATVERKTLHRNHPGFWKSTLALPRDEQGTFTPLQKCVGQNTDPSSLPDRPGAQRGGVGPRTR